MKQNVDLTEQGHFSEGWMTGGWTAKGVFRKRKPMKTSQKFKDILKMGDDKPYGVSSIVAKLFGMKLPAIVWGGNNLTFGDQVMSTGGSQWATSTTTATTNGVWIQTDIS